MNVSVLGAGGWGTAVARLLCREGHQTTLWARDPAKAADLKTSRVNARYLPDIDLPPDLAVTSDLASTLDAETLFLAVPSFAMKELIQKISSLETTAEACISLSKGLDRETQTTMCEVIADGLPGTQAMALSGPSHAEEVGRDMPTAVVLACHDLSLGARLQTEIATSRFRVYLSDDPRGVELCATIKNIIALATGISDGLGYGDNSRAALITRGLTEMVRFAAAFDVRQETFFGLSGLGDLVATCTSQHSRNRHVGYRLGQGEPLAEILADMEMVAEGVFATEIVYDMARARSIDMPITHAVKVLLEGRADPVQLMETMMSRAPKREGF